MGSHAGVFKSMEDPIDEAFLLTFLEQHPFENKENEFLTPPFDANDF